MFILFSWVIWDVDWGTYAVHVGEYSSIWRDDSGIYIAYSDGTNYATLFALSRNNGMTWDLSPVEFYPYQIIGGLELIKDGIGKYHIFAVVGNFLYHYTSSDGITWTKDTLLDNAHEISGFFTGGNIYVVAQADSLLLLKSTDNGNTWDTVTISSQGGYYINMWAEGDSIWVIYNDVISTYFCCSYSWNGGTTWNSYTFTGTSCAAPGAICARKDTLHIMVCLSGLTLSDFITTDWSWMDTVEIENISNGACYGVSLQDSLILFFTDYDTFWVHSSPNGYSWKNIYKAKDRWFGVYGSSHPDHPIASIPIISNSTYSLYIWDGDTALVDPGRKGARQTGMAWWEQPHILYYIHPESVKHAVGSGDVWDITQVESGEVQTLEGGEILHGLLYPNTYVRSEDNGATWISSTIMSGNPGDLAVKSPDTIYFTCSSASEGVVFGYSYDGGLTWNRSTLGPPSSTPPQICVNDSGYIFIAEDDEMFMSMNGGTTWTSFSYTSSASPGDMVARDSIVVLVYCANDTMKAYISHDRGHTWNKYPIATITSVDGCDIEFDPAGNLHGVYDDLLDVVFFYSNDLSNFKTEVVDGASCELRRPSLTHNPYGDIFVAYTTNLLKVAKRTLLSPFLLISPTGGEGVDTTFTLVWSRCQGVESELSHYSILIYDTAWSVVAETVYDTSYTITLKDGFYKWMVYAYDTTGNKRWAGPDSFYVVASGVEKEHPSIRIHNSMVVLEIPQKTKVCIRIYDVSGRIRKSVKGTFDGEITIPLPETPGVYFIHYIIGQKEGRVKGIKI